MAKKSKVVELTREQKIEKALSDKISSYGIRQIEDPLSGIPTPPDHFKHEIGQEVEIGNLSDVKIVKISDDRKFVVVEYSRTENNYGNPVVTDGCIGCWVWFDAIPKKTIEVTKFTVNASYDMMNARTSQISSLLSKVTYFGTDDKVNYQRDYVWTLEDEQRLIKSIFEGLDIGKFVFISYEWPRTDDEVLDGKQRLNTIIRFITNQFQYQGLYWYQLSSKDRYAFENHSVQYIELKGDKLTEADKLRIFLRVNVAGVPQSQEHLAGIYKRLNDLIQ